VAEFTFVSVVTLKRLLYMSTVWTMDEPLKRITQLHITRSVKTRMIVPARKIYQDFQTQTPPLVYTNEVLYMMSNISSLVPGVHWYLGQHPFSLTSFLSQHLVFLFRHSVQ
jgi:hypothetical protein